MSNATLEALAPSHAPTFTPPAIYPNSLVEYSNGQGNVWVPAIVNRVGATGGIECTVISHDGSGVGSDVGGAHVHIFVRGGVRHIDDPFGQSELYRNNTIADGDGGYWRLTKQEELLREELEALRSTINRRQGNKANAGNSPAD